MGEGEVSVTFGSGAPNREFLCFVIVERATDETFFFGTAFSCSFVSLLSEQLAVDDFSCWSGVMAIAQEAELCGRQRFCSVDEEGTKLCWKADWGKKKACWSVYSSGWFVRWVGSAWDVCSDDVVRVG